MKQITKRIITLAIAAATLVSLAGCGGGQKSASGSDDKVLTVYTARSESLNNLVIPNFEKDTGIKVNVVVAGTGPLLKRVSSEKSNPQGDILWAADQTILEYQEDLVVDDVKPEE